MEYESALLERVAQRFRRDMWMSVVPEAVTESGIEVQAFGPVQATAFGELPEVPGLNQILGAAEPGAIENGDVASAIEWMRAREVDYCVPVAAVRPGAAEAEAWLRGRRYERGVGWLKLVREATPPELPEDPGIVVYELGAEEGDGEGLSTIVAEALAMPVIVGTLFFSLPQTDGWRCYTAARDPEVGIVATGSMLIHDGVAMLGLDATLEEGREQGCHMALIQRRLRDAAEAGCHTVVTELGEYDPDCLAVAYRNLRRAGFEEAYHSRSWQRPALHPAEVC